MNDCNGCVKDRYDPNECRGGLVYDVKHLRYFLAVANERSFTRGAERLNMAQSPLSRRIQEMENELGVRLFDRDARPLALTPAGQIFYEQAVQVIQRAEQMRASMKRYVASERPRFVIGTGPSVLYTRLPYVVRRFRARAPNVELSLTEMTSAEQVVALREGRINVGIGRLRCDDPSVRRKILREERFVVAMAPDCPLAATPGALGLDAIASMTLVLYPREPRPSYADLVLSLFQDVGLYPQNVIEVREMQTALVMAAAGEGVCIVPESVERIGRADVCFRGLAGGHSVPIILRHRVDDKSEELATLFSVFGDVQAKWDLPRPQFLYGECDPHDASDDMDADQPLA